MIVQLRGGAISFAACWLATGAIVCGCEDSSKSSDDGSAMLGPARPVTLDSASGAEPARDDAGSTGGAESLASQFERDMAAFRAMRENGGGSSPSGGGAIDEGGGDPGDAGSTGAALTDGNPSTRVIFNGPESIGGGGASRDGNPEPNADRLPRWDPNAPFGPRGASAVPSNGPAITAPGAVEERATAADAQARLREAMVAMRRELFQHASFDDAPLREYLAMAALSMVDPERMLDPDALYDLDDREKELVGAYQAFFQKLGAELAASGDEEALVKLVDELKLAIVDRGPLRIARAELCTRVDGFGRYTPFDKYAFLAGNGQDVVIYTEIEEFTSEENDKGEWVTDLWQELIIYDAHDNVPVWHQEWRAAPDVSMRKRQDFFVSYVVTLPERLTVGSYTLKVRVRDEKSSSIAESGIPFIIVADPKLAARLPE